MNIRFGYSAACSELARLKELLTHKALLILTGPSGAGKGTIAASLLNDRSLEVERVRLHVVKPTKTMAADDAEYRYVSQTSFEDLRRAGEFLQWQKFPLSGYYGISIRVLFQTLQRSSCALIDIGVEAALGLQALLQQHGISHLACFISPVALDTLKSCDGVNVALSVLEIRMRRRNRGESECDLISRLETARQWLSEVLQLPLRVVENSDGKQDDTYRQVAAMIWDHLRSPASPMRREEEVQWKRH